MVAQTLGEAARSTIGMRFLLNTAWTILVGVVIGLLVVANEDAVKRFVSNGGLVAEVTSGPYFPYPEEPLRSTRAPRPGSFVASATDETETIARMVIQNVGTETASDIRLKFKYAPDALIVDSAGGKNKTYKGVEEIFIDDMKPGDIRTLFLWRSVGFGYPFNLDDLRSFSSAGPIRVELKSRVVSSYEDPFIIRFMDSWGSFLLTGVLFILAFGALLMATFLERYAKMLLSGEDFYLQESVKFADNPKSFVPDIDNKDAVAKLKS